MRPEVLRSDQSIAANISAKPDFIRDYSALKFNVDELIKQTSIEQLASQLSPIEGVGSPEGVVVANYSKLYIDTTNAPTSVSIYFNSNIGSSTGWVEA